jgi:hypothetical protein
MGPGGYCPGGIWLWEEVGSARQDLEFTGQLPVSLSWRGVGSELTANCRVGVLRSKLEEPGRRIGKRGDASRAPTQGPRPGWAAGRRPSASRDWP